ncbi:MAG: hypothetical protein J0647_03960 [Campylobacteraceae bacterium]|nr:hypothetical protein [Campylobacteraceae bacterium]
MKKIILFITLVLIWIVLLFPKDTLWDTFEKIMYQKNISINAKEVDMQLYLLYNKISIKDMSVLNNYHIKKFVTTYSIAEPLYVLFDGNSEYGDFRGKISLLEQKGFVILKAKTINNSLLKNFKKDKEGMKYEFTY